MMRRDYRTLQVLHFFIGIGALFGGLVALIDPYEPLGIPVEILENSPFDSFFIPGLILFLIIGVGHIFSGLSVYRWPQWQGYISSVFFWALVIWIVVQCIMLRSVEVLHLIYFAIGLYGAALAMRLLFDKNLFPANLFKQLLKKKK